MSKSCGSKANHLAKQFGVRKDEFPTKYLGFPLAGGNLKCSHFDTCMDRLKEILERWPVKNTSMVGLITLIQVVVHGLLIFWVQQGEVLVSCRNRMEIITVDFLWASHNDLMAWH